MEIAFFSQVRGEAEILEIGEDVRQRIVERSEELRQAIHFEE